MKAIPYIAACGVLLLSACSGEPSERAIRKAFDRSLSEAMQNSGEAGAAFGLSPSAVESLTPKLHSLKKIGCKAAQGAEGYNCDVEIDIELPIFGRQKDTTNVRLVKASDGWRVLD